MLDCLHIENIAVIERADIRFTAGFTALTGETGAGKSIIIDAINAVLGERTRRDLVRTGSNAAHVTALFSELSPAATAQIEALGFSTDEDGNLLIGRTISAEGKGSCSVNGRPATAALLREIGKVLVDLHGQHENQALFSVDSHLAYLDRFGELTEQRERYVAVYREWRQIVAELDRVDLDESEKARKLDMLSFQIDEIEAANLTAGEEEELIAKRDLFRNAEKVASQLNTANALLLGDEDSDGAVSMAEQAVSSVRHAARYLEKAESLSEQLQNALYELQAATEELQDLTDLLDFDPRELDEVENRLEVIRRLTSKYGATTADVLAFLENAKAEYRQIELSDEQLKQLTERERTAFAAAQLKADALTNARLLAAENFAKAVKEQLTFLDMPNVTLTIDRQPIALGVNGADKVEFLLSANAGELPKPLARIASGGELSRIMLAIKSVLADADEVDTLIFDEIDTGISGRAALKVGARLRQTAATANRRRQVLCVTHLAQIAAQANEHFLIEKSVRDGRTYTDVTMLSRTDRERELARIIGGEVTDAAIQAAKEMLKGEST
ncbi:MAG: DNA repair protein RecN [Clostridia bacterium]|nr:DNA repair protein RecN [Clostridia bacterium]